MNFTRLVFDLYTVKYLGFEETAVKCIEKLKILPTRYIPTKTQNFNGWKGLFSFNNTEIFMSFFPNGEMPPFQFWVNLYKIKNLFNFTVESHILTNEELLKTPGMKFNYISMSVMPWENNVESENDFKILHDIWIYLCREFDAAYGYCYFEDATKGCTPRGEGRCIPRLHWNTYFGQEYTAVLNIDSLMNVDYCKIHKLDKGSLVEIYGEEAKNLMYSNKIEDSIINHLGKSYFWSDQDNWRNPKLQYDMPSFDLSEVLIE